MFIEVQFFVKLKENYYYAKLIVHISKTCRQ